MNIQVNREEVMYWTVGEPEPGLGLFVVELYQRGSDIFRVACFDDANCLIDINSGEEIKATIAQHLLLPNNHV